MFAGPCVRVQRQHFGLRDWGLGENSVSAHSSGSFLSRAILALGSYLTNPFILVPSENTTGNAILHRNGPCCFHLEPLHNLRFFPQSVLL